MSEEIIPHFTILLVDDKPRTMFAQRKRIEGYLKSKNLVLNWIEDKGDEKAKHAFEILKSVPVDVILLDNAINRNITGLDILKKVRDNHDLTDILFYSASPEHQEIFTKASSFRFTVVVQGREIADSLEDLIDKNLMKWENIVFLRGIVISRVIELEHKINELFAIYFSIANPHMDNFHSLILESGQGSLQTKKKAISRILKIEGWEEKFKGFSNLTDLQEDRNLLAHGKLKKDEKNVLVVKSFGTTHQFRKYDLDKILEKIQKLSKLVDEIIHEIKISRKKAV